ncbi:50S ribosomal protein L13 [bacterium]|nr:50S ribosomal protein L13 [bacterium]
MKAQASTLPKPAEIQEKWYLIDAEHQVVGRLAARIAQLIRGKLEPTYSPHLDPKIHIVVINAEKAIFTGKKMQDKIYYHHSGWRTGIKSINAAELLEKKPEEILRTAIHGMLPKNRLGTKLRKNLRVYAGPEHEHQAQQPETLVIHTRQPKVEKD